jgi:hypothetical protein
MKRMPVLIGCGGLLLVCILIAVVAAAGGIVGTQPVADAGNAFLNALKQSNYDQAYSLCSPELQTKLGSAQQLKATVEQGKAQPVSWSFNSRSMSGNSGDLEGSVTMIGGVKGTVTLSLVKSGGAWKIIGFNLQQS